MNWAEYGITTEEIALLSPENVQASPAAIVLLKICKSVFEKQSRRVVAGELGTSEDKPRQDFRYALGECGLALTLLDCPKEAKKWISSET